MFQTNPAVKQTERLCRHSLELDEFLARETMWPRLFSRPLHTCVFQEISCVQFLICFLLCRLFLWNLGKSFNLILNCFVQGAIHFMVHICRIT